MAEQIAEWQVLCECGHGPLVHDLNRKQVRTVCSVQTPKGYCGCTLYEPVTEAAGA